eukprot:gnl/MRDRNA2_/MRDRNA2_113780_c0_seq1.p1 gnl/MRDRNA2_/MRDRNA2_113780_c0~~gnl/MRDRNA2_/MRDRNA2_113780_c0_seq1.p1  ORF type:complete len:618 (+),score=136.10 gnl/MRDRNA2_/MRDRNA2_113780_c0_seq1:153-1856(+)
MVSDLNKLTDHKNTEADRLAKLDSQFKVFHHKATEFQEDVQDAFSLLLVQTLHSKTGYCCCFRDQINGDICRWNQAQKYSWYFKTKGCSVLGLESYDESIRNDKNAGVMAMRSAGLCAAFVQSALQMANSGSDLFEKQAWENPAPIKQYLSHFGDKGSVVAAQWNEARQLRDASRSAMWDLLSKRSCDIQALRWALKDAYKAYLPPSEYTATINRLSDCVEARDKAEKMVTPGEAWDPEIDSEGVQTISGLLNFGGTEEKKLKLAFDKEVGKRTDVQARIKDHVTEYQSRSSHGANAETGSGSGGGGSASSLASQFQTSQTRIHTGLGRSTSNLPGPPKLSAMALWTKAITMGLPPGEVKFLLESSLDHATDADLQAARAIAKKKKLLNLAELDKLNLEMAEHTDTQNLVNSLTGQDITLQVEEGNQEGDKSSNGEDSAAKLEILPEDSQSIWQTDLNAGGKGGGTQKEESLVDQPGAVGSSSPNEDAGALGSGSQIVEPATSSFLQSHRQGQGVSPHHSSRSDSSSFLQMRSADANLPGASNGPLVDQASTQMREALKDLRSAWSR